MKMTFVSLYLRRWYLSATIAVLATLGSYSIHAQDVDPADEEIEEVISVGTKRDGRSASDLSVPVDVFSSDDLRKQGSSNLLDVLSSVAPSYNVGRESITDAATFVRPANLRSLPTDSTLILFNTKRRHKSAAITELASSVNKGAHGVDLFPIIAIGLKQVEILRDGASAQYGSDAIAGVINFELEDDPTVRRVQVQVGSTYVGDGDNYNLAAVLGAPLGLDGSVVFSFEYGGSEPTDRGSQLPAAARLNELTDRPDPSGGPDGRVHNIPSPAIIWGAPRIDDNLKGMINASLPLGGTGIELYGFSTYSSRKSNSSFFFRNPYTRSNVYAVGSGLLIADLTPGPVGQDNGARVADGDGMDCPAVSVTNGVGDATELQAIIADPNCFNFYELFPDGFTPRFDGTVRDASVVGGLRGTFPKTELDYDLSIAYGENRINYRLLGTVNASYGPNTLRDFYIGSQIQSDLVINIDLSLPLQIGSLPPVFLAFGAQRHEENYETIAGQDESWMDGGYSNQEFSVGSNGFQGFRADEAGKSSRTNQGVYFEADADITAKWLVVGSLRYDDYSDFGSTTNAKLSTRFEITDNFSLRGGLSTGFRAPSVGQINLRRSSTIFVGGQLAEALTLPVTNATAIALGAQPLQPEKAENFSVGGAFSLGPVDLTLDGYYITVKNRLIQNTETITPERRMMLNTQGATIPSNIGRVLFFVNSFSSETKGIELVGTLPVDWGKAGYGQVVLAYSWTDTRIEDRGTVLEDYEVDTLESGLPAHRATLTWTHSQGCWTALTRINYYGSTVENLYDDPAQQISTGDVTIVDLEMSFDLPTEQGSYTLAFGLNNVFDRYLKQHRFVHLPSHGGANYPLTHPAGFSGGSYYVRLSAEF